MASGWFGQSYRHALAARGVSSRYEYFGKKLVVKDDSFAKPLVLEKKAGGDLEVVSHTAASRGYPTVTHNGRTEKMMRFLWEKKHGRIPKGMVVRHMCHNKHCVNVAHMKLGSQKQNIQDNVKIGSVAHGHRHGAVKITPKIAKTIYDSKDSNVELSERYGLAASTVGQIKRGEIWSRQNTGSVDTRRHI